MWGILLIILGCSLLIKGGQYAILSVPCLMAGFPMFFVWIYMEKPSPQNSPEKKCGLWQHEWTKWDYFWKKIEFIKGYGIKDYRNEEYKRRMCLKCGLKQERKYYDSDTSGLF